MSEKEIVLNTWNHGKARRIVRLDKYNRIQIIVQAMVNGEWIDAPNIAQNDRLTLSDCEKIAQEWGRDKKWEKLREIVNEKAMQEEEGSKELCWYTARGILKAMQELEEE